MTKACRQRQPALLVHPLLPTVTPFTPFGRPLHGAEARRAGFRHLVALSHKAVAALRGQSETASAWTPGPARAPAPQRAAKASASVTSTSAASANARPAAKQSPAPYASPSPPPAGAGAPEHGPPACAHPPSAPDAATARPGPR